MTPWHLSVTLLGHTLLDVRLGNQDSPPPPEQPSDAPGPVTDRRSPPITQIGFHPKSRWADGRDQW